MIKLSLSKCLLFQLLLTTCLMLLAISDQATVARSASLLELVPRPIHLAPFQGPNGSLTVQEMQDNLIRKATTQQKIDMFERYSGLFQRPELQCSAVFDGDKDAINNTVNLAKIHRELPLLSEDYYINLTSNCDNFLQTRGYITSTLTEQERNFPIAFSLLTYNEIEMTERLVRTIYRPQNLYCIHIDSKADEKFFAAMKSTAACFQNIFMSSRRVNVVWETWTVLEPELICMEDLWRKGFWRYFINLTGQEMPLKTNYELVKILTAYNGANDVDTTRIRMLWDRWNDTNAPYGLRHTKGSVHVTVNRDFVDYLLHNDTALGLLKWVKITYFPDETFFTILNHNPQLRIPGTYKGSPETTKKKEEAVFDPLQELGPNKYPCASGYWLRQICQLSTGDLPLMCDTPHLFAKRFQITHDRHVISCLEERHFNRTRDAHFGRITFNVTYYDSPKE